VFSKHYEEECGLIYENSRIKQINKMQELINSYKRFYGESLPTHLYSTSPPHPLTSTSSPNPHPTPTPTLFILWKV
jgi:hypothetical protein